MSVRQLRLSVTCDDYDAALLFYRDVLGMTVEGVYAGPHGSAVAILDAGRATLELVDPVYAAYIDEVEVGRRVAGHVRVAIEVDDVGATSEAVRQAGAFVLAEPTRTPWGSLNARFEAPAGLQLTLFEELGADGAA
jgi:predicted enzyme related to lactoylglutathione lyase